jgi:NitT/TauT family transport system substrate-binding protein
MTSPRFRPSRRTFVQGLVAAPFVLRAAPSFAADTNLKFSLAASFDGSTAPFLLADQQGWYKAAGLNVQFDQSGGSGEAISRVGSGVYDLGIADINGVAEFDSKNPAAAVRCVYMVYYRSPLCIATVTKSGITTARELTGKKLGDAVTDGAYRVFPAFAKATGLDPNSVTWDLVGMQLREALLARGDVDAIVGFDSTMYFGLVKAGVDPSTIKFIYYSDAGLDLYGNGIIVSEKLRTQSPDVVKSFVAVSAKAWQSAAADPKGAIAALKAHTPLIDADLEEQKLRWLIKNQLTSPESLADGLGGVHTDRLASALTKLTPAYGLASIPTPADVYDGSFLPSAELRKLPA